MQRIALQWILHQFLVTLLLLEYLRYLGYQCPICQRMMNGFVFIRPWYEIKCYLRIWKLIRMLLSQIWSLRRSRIYEWDFEKDLKMGLPINYFWSREAIALNLTFFSEMGSKERKIEFSQPFLFVLSILKRIAFVQQSIFGNSKR